jgi:D-glycero-D-manno-heptose 1,7-bisphosphate phosphatase
LLREIGSRFHVDLRTLVVIGDSLRDVEAARSVGATPLLVRTGKGRQTLDRLGDKLDVPRFEDLAEVTDRLLDPNASRLTSG